MAKNWPIKVHKWSDIAQSGLKWPAWSDIAKSGQNDLKVFEMVQSGLY